MLWLISHINQNGNVWDLQGFSWQQDYGETGRVPLGPLEWSQSVPRASPSPSIAAHPPGGVTQPSLSDFCLCPAAPPALDPSSASNRALRIFLHPAALAGAGEGHWDHGRWLQHQNRSSSSSPLNNEIINDLIKLSFPQCLDEGFGSPGLIHQPRVASLFPAHNLLSSCYHLVVWTLRREKCPKSVLNHREQEF